MYPFEIFGNKEIIENQLPISFTFGNFDGVHLGHQFIFSKINKTAPNPVVVMTFDPHPANYFNQDLTINVLTTQKQKIDLLLNFGVDVVIVQNFESSFSKLSPDEFCQKFLAQHFNIKHIFMGYNLFYGKNREGDFFHMQKMCRFLNWQAHLLSAHTDNLGNIISSSLIRSALSDGRPQDAAKYLGRLYSIAGTVFQGDQRGRELGYPTANIKFNPNIVIPKHGVYSVEVEFPNRYPGKQFSGVMNCGVRPTVQTSSNLQMETYILDFNENVYGEEVIFYLKNFIRKEQRFSSLAHLKEQMYRDVQLIKN